MMPVVFKIPGIGYEVPGYGLALMIGFLVSIMWATRRAIKSGANPDVVLNCGFLALIGGVVGSRAMYVAHHWADFASRGTSAQVFWAVIDVRKGGLEVYGGVLIVVVLVLLYLWLGKHSIRWYLDIMAPSTALGMSIGRIGCFVNGCCWGGVCDQLPWAVRFPFGSPAAVQQWAERQPGAGLPAELLLIGEYADGAAVVPIPRETLRASDQELDAARKAIDEIAPRLKELDAQVAQATDPQEQRRLETELDTLNRQFKTKFPQYVAIAAPLMSKYNLSAAQLRALAREHPSLPVHPTQIYSVITLGLVAWLLSAIYWRRTRDGQVICALFVIEPPTRWVIELVRPDNPIDVLGVFTISQFLAICLVPLGLIGLWWLHYLPPRSHRAAIWVPPEEEPADKKKAKRTT